MLIPDNKNKRTNSNSSIPDEFKKVRPEEDNPMSSSFDLLQNPFSVWDNIVQKTTESFDKLNKKANSIKLNKLVPNDKTVKYASKTADALLSTVPIMNSYMDAQDTNQLANESIQQNVFGNVSPKKRYNYDFVGENDPLFALHAKLGIAVDGNVPVNAEGNEVYLQSSTGKTIPIEGKSHAEGGVNFKAEDGSYVLSDTITISKEDLGNLLNAKIKSSKKEYTIAEAVKKFPHYFNTQKEGTILEEQLDPLRRATIEFNMKEKLSKLSKLLAYQQEKNGNNGEQTTMKYGGLIAKKGSKNKYNEARDSFSAEDKNKFHTELEAAIKRGDKTFNFKGLEYAAKEDPNYNSGLMKNKTGLSLTDNYSDEQGGQYYTNPNYNPSDLVYTKPELRTKNQSIQNTGTSGYANIDMTKEEYATDFRNRHSDIWQQFDMGNWKPSDYMNKDKVLQVQKALKAKGFDIKEDGYFGQETFQVPGIKLGDLPPVAPNLNLDNPEKPISDIITPNTPIVENTKKNKLYKEKLPISQYTGLIDDPKSTNYREVYDTNEINPNLISLRSAKNDVASQFNTLVASNSGNASVDNLRKNAGFAEVQKANSEIAEKENNTNAEILNKFAEYNNTVKNQNQALQQAANSRFVLDNNQDLAARIDDRKKKLLDLAANQTKVNQYNAQLRLMDDLFGKNFDVVSTPDGPAIKRNDEIITFDNLNNFSQLAQTYGQMNTNPYTKTEDADTQNKKAKSSKKMGGKNSKKLL